MHLFNNRFPFIASEIFNCEINQILDKFFDQIDNEKKEESTSDFEEMAGNDQKLSGEEAKIEESKQEEEKE